MSIGIGLKSKKLLCITEIAGFQKNISDLELLKKHNIQVKILLMIKDDNYILKVSQKKIFWWKVRSDWL